jgi:hypothetical protein
MTSMVGDLAVSITSCLGSTIRGAAPIIWALASLRESSSFRTAILPVVRTDMIEGGIPDFLLDVRSLLPDSKSKFAISSFVATVINEAVADIATDEISPVSVTLLFSSRPSALTKKG